MTKSPSLSSVRQLLFEQNQMFPAFAIEAHLTSSFHSGAVAGAVIFLAIMYWILASLLRKRREKKDSVG